MDEITDLFTRHVFYHATSLETTEQIVQEGFRERFFSDDGELNGSGGNLGDGIYITVNWRIALWFGRVLLRVQLRPGTRVLDACQPPDAKIINYLRREFGRQILTESPWRAMPRNKQLTLPELISLFRYHYYHYWERPYRDGDGLRRWPDRKEFHGDLLRNFRSLLIRYGYHGYGNPSDDNGIVLFSGDRVVLHSLIGELPPSIHRQGYEDDFASIPSTEEVRRIFLQSGSTPARNLAARIASRTAGHE
jgi:hypothetical protein